MKKTILLTLLIISFSYASTQVKNELPRTVDAKAQVQADKQLKLQNKEIIKLVVEEVSKKLPLKIDNYTQQTGIKAKDLTLISIFEINTGAKSDEAVRLEDKPRMQSFIIKGICQSSKRFLQSDINISYVYNSAKSKDLLFSFDVTKKDCDTIWK